MSTPRDKVHAVTTASAAPRRRHAFMACDACRNQKLRCEGGSPCNRCARLQRPCVYRTSARRRLPRPESWSAPAGRPANTGTCLQIGFTYLTTPVDPSDKLIRCILRRVQVSQRNSGLHHVVFGPTSNVSFLRYLLMVMLWGDVMVEEEDEVLNPPRDHALVVDGDDSVDFFHYRPLLESLWSSDIWSELAVSPPTALGSIQLDILDSFLVVYTATAYTQLPVQPTASFYTWLRDASQVPMGYAATETDLVALLFALGIGSTMTCYHYLGTMLAKEASLLLNTKAATSVNYVQYYLHREYTEDAYALLGTMASQIHTAGLLLNCADDVEQKLLLGFYSIQSYTCMVLGRPAILLLDAVQVPEFQSLSALDTMRTVSLIFTQIQHLHSMRDLTVDTFWAGAAGVRQLLEEFRNGILPEPPKPIVDDDKEDNGRIGHPLEVLYYYSLIILYRPLQILQASANVDDTRIPEYVEIIVGSAKKIISFFRKHLEVDSHVRYLPSNAYFLETACLSLILDSLNPPRSARHVTYIQMTIDSLAELQFQPAAAARLTSLREILRSASLQLELDSSPLTDVTPGAPQEILPPSMEWATTLPWSYELGLPEGNASDWMWQPVT